MLVMAAPFSLVVTQSADLPPAIVATLPLSALMVVTPLLVISLLAILVLAKAALLVMLFANLKILQ